MIGTAAQSGWSYADSTWLLDEHGRFEIITGRLCFTRWFTPAHQELAARVFMELAAFTKRERQYRAILRPPLLFADNDYLVPDLALLPWPWRTPPAPLLVVEVVSEGTAERDCGIKRQRYAHYGIREYWLADAGRRWIEVYRLQEDSEQPAIVTDSLCWEPVKGGSVLEMDVSELFADLR